MKKSILAAALLLIAAFSASAAAKPRTLSSPDGNISVSITTDAGLCYSVSVAGRQIINPSEISLTLTDGSVYGGKNPGSCNAVARSYSGTIASPFYKKASVEENYNELTLKFRNYSVIFRVYDDGVAYRFVSASRKDFCVRSEKATFAFAKNWEGWFPINRGDFHTSFESRYTIDKLSHFPKNKMAFLPLLVDAGEGVKVCITEADLLHYPGMFLQNTNGSSTLTGLFAPYPKNRVPEPGNRVISMYVEGTEDYIAKCAPGCVFPWRIIGISTDDEKLADSDLVFKLAESADPKADFSWVKPGKVAWDWWNNWNLYGVDFRAGINTETYKYYVDFASSKGIEYVILDEGWSPSATANLYEVIPDIDLDDLLAYAASKNVGIILWAGFYPFQKDVEGLCKYYSEKGVKGFKVDFFDSDDQQIPELIERCAKAAAENHLLLDFHGFYKPTGLSRKYPNVLNYEGVYGLETSKWDASAEQVDYDVQIPFIRFFAGPADYTQGAMRNGALGSIHSSNSEPMSAGTRCHQLGEYVVFFSPLNMLCDSPSNYLAEAECTDFIAGVPTVWDETKVLDAEVGAYVVTARRSGSDWYIGGINNWDERDVILDLSLLGEGDFEIELFRDGVNADKAGRDYKKIVGVISSSDPLKVHMAPGGGFAAKFSKK